MSIEDDVALFERVPILALMSVQALNMLAIGAESRELSRGEELFRSSDIADAGFMVRTGSISVQAEGSERGVVARPGMLIGELALIVGTRRGALAVALEPSSVIRLSRGLFQRVLESHPEAARQLRNNLAARARDSAGSMATLTGKLR